MMRDWDDYENDFEPQHRIELLNQLKKVNDEIHSVIKENLSEIEQTEQQQISE